MPPPGAPRKRPAAAAAVAAVRKRPAAAKATGAAPRRPAAATGASLRRPAVAGAAPRRDPAARAAPAGRDHAPAKRARRQQGQGISLGLPELDSFPTIFAFEAQLEKGNAGAYGLHVDETRCLMGDDGGLVVDVDRETGEPKTSFRLPDGVRCVVGDGDYLYVGTHGGAIYDLGGGRPRLVAQIEGFGKLLWIDIHGGRIAAADNQGNVGLLDCEGELLWKMHVDGGTDGWMCRMDGTGIYYGASGISKFDLRGNILWHAAKDVEVAFGIQTQAHVWAIGLVPKDVAKTQAQVVKVCKESGELLACIDVDELNACGVAPDESRVYDGKLTCQPVPPMKGGHVTFGGAAWKSTSLPGLDHFLSLQVVGNRIYGVGAKGNMSKFLCIDVSDDALAAAASGAQVLRKTRSRTWNVADQSREMAADEGQETQEVSSADGKVILRCVTEGGKVRARVVSPGYDGSLNCQFPRALRKEGARFVVDAVDLAPAGDFYRCRGEPMRLRD